MAQQISLRYQPAHLGRRLGAYYVDLMVIVLVQVLGAEVGGVFFAMMAYAEGVSSNAALPVLMNGQEFGAIFWGSAAWVLNFGLLQSVSGSTIGKKLFKIGVYRIDGQNLSIASSLLRSVPVMLPPLPYHFMYGSIFMNENRRGVHDLWSRSVVATGKPRLVPLLDQQTKLLPVPKDPSDHKAA